MTRHTSNPPPYMPDPQEENRRLRRVVETLMDRAEAIQGQGVVSAYDLFRQAASLEETVRARTAELETTNQQLSEEVTRRRDAEQAMLQAKAEAEQANENKTRFLTAVSHDLQQPLTAARLLLHTLVENSTDDEAQDLAAGADATLKTMEDLLLSLVDISRLETGAFHCQPAPFPLQPMLERLATEYHVRAEVEGLSFRHMPCSAVVHADPVLVDRVLHNLLSNALRYTESGRIVLGCRRRPSGVDVLVLDTGVGVPADQRERIFREFSQLDARPGGREKGLGLGLAIVERIAALMATPLIFHSRPGHGSTFGIHLPYGRAEPEQPAPAGPGRSTPGRLSGRHLAVVDNDPAVLTALENLLRSWGSSVTPCLDREELLGAMEQPPVPELVLLDYHLDDGVLADAVLDTLESGRSVPVIIMTSHPEPGMRQRMAERGARVLAKPLDPDKLRDALAAALPRT
ncbi:ATP-binding protein [Aquisalimonas lutea]|uniref:ATP-binding response regulator n=1 Tax=Aquisalimonas lutea TaxID=1327750 RepID=UPI0025B403BB|nr:ATP-binding protein [Aquisalimonas lutea]MDN3518214.1 ATP-binding protein [Aquisalimonas lutea]